MDNIQELAKKLNEIDTMAYNIYENATNYIIENKITDIESIERTLDGIMSIGTLDTSILFNRLCSYYRNINIESANDYKKLYKMFK